MCVDTGRGLERRRRRGPSLLQRIPHVPIDHDRLPGTPYKTAAEEYREKEHAVVPLSAAAGHVDLVKEPVDIEEGA